MKKFNVAIKTICVVLLLFLIIIYVDNREMKKIGLSGNLYTSNHIFSSKGFFGDGSNILLFFSEEKDKNTIKEKLSKDKNWMNLPVTKEVEERIGGSISLNNGELDEPTLEMHSSYLRIPKIEKGYFYYKNTNEIDENVSSNFLFAIFDENNNTVYYYEFDS